MTIIYAATDGQHLIGTIIPKLAQNNVDSVRLSVDFDSSWDSYPARTAVFTTSKSVRPYPVTLSSTNNCLIPAEVLAEECKLYIVVRGENSTTGATKASTRLTVRVLGGHPAVIISDPSPSVYQQLLTACGENASSIEVALARLNTLIAYSESGSLPDDSWAVDILTGFDGTSYSTAGEAVREQAAALYNILSAVAQKNLSANPLQPILFDQYKYYHGTSTGTVCDVMTSPRYSLGDFDEYLSVADDVSGSSHGVCARLATPIPVFEDPAGEYVAIIKSGKTFPRAVQFFFSSAASWDTSACTIVSCNAYIAKGYNVVPLSAKSFTDNGHLEFTHVCVNAGATSLADADTLEMYIVKSDAFLKWVEHQAHADSKYLVPNPARFTSSANNITPTVTIDGSKITADFPATESEEAVWRYGLIGYNLGTEIAGKKILVRSTSLGITPKFGIGKSSSSWMNKGFTVDNGEYLLVDVEEFIADNETLSTHTGDFFVTLGIDFGTNISNDATSIEFEIMLVNDHKILDPYAAWFGYKPSDFERAGGQYITCWGDSLTAQGGWTDTLAELSGMTVYNAGTGGENVRTITARQGADVIMVNDITIPADVEPITIATYASPLTTAFGFNATPLLQGGAHVNPVKLGDIEGTLAWTGSSYSDTSGTWTFTRSEAGDEVVIDRPTALTTAYDREKNSPYLMIIFMGQNGGYNSDNEELVNLHRLMIDHANAKHVIVLGLSSGSASSRADYESAMRKAFGRYFISLREYLSQYGLDDAGLTPTEADTTAMESGTVPPQLLADSVHYTAATKTVIGNLIYKRCCELGIFEA